MSSGKSDIDRAIYGYANVQQYKTDVAFISLVEGVLDNLYVIPDFQRVYKWTEPQVENLAISLVKGMPIPPIYAYRNNEGQLEILDGQQRVLSMLFYYVGKYKKKKHNSYINLHNITKTNKPFMEQLKEKYELKDKKYKMKYYDLVNGKEVEKTVDITYRNLPINVKRKVDYTPITVIEINIDNERLRERYLYKIFANLNSGGTPLTPQELRNGIYRCKFYDMLYEFNDKNEKWIELFGTGDNYSRNIGYLLRFCVFKYFIKFQNNNFIFNVENYNNMNKLLNDFSEIAIKFNDETICEYRNSLEKFMSLLKGKISKRVLRIALLESLFAVTNKTNMQIYITQTVFDNILKNDDYNATVRTGNATKSAIETKLEVVYDEICKYAK